MGGPTHTGLNETKVNDCMKTANDQADKVMEEITNQFNKVLAAIAKGWGTTDAVTYVTDTLVPDLKVTGLQIARDLQQIGLVIKSTGEKQASDTNNKFSINPATMPALGELVNNTAEKLDNGFVGIYDDLKKNVEAAGTTLKTEVDKKLGTLQSQVQGKTDVAFVDTGKADAVSEQIITFINAIQSSLDSAFDKVMETINASTADADQYAHDIQAAGLRKSGVS